MNRVRGILSLLLTVIYAIGSSASVYASTVTEESTLAATLGSPSSVEDRFINTSKGAQSDELTIDEAYQTKLNSTLVNVKTILAQNGVTQKSIYLKANLSKGKFQGFLYSNKLIPITIDDLEAIDKAAHIASLEAWEAEKIKRSLRERQEQVIEKLNNVLAKNKIPYTQLAQMAMVDYNRFKDMINKGMLLTPQEHTKLTRTLHEIGEKTDFFLEYSSKMINEYDLNMTQICYKLDDIGPKLLKNILSKVSPSTIDRQKKIVYVINDICKDIDHHKRELNILKMKLKHAIEEDGIPKIFIAKEAGIHVHAARINKLLDGSGNATPAEIAKIESAIKKLTQQTHAAKTRAQTLGNILSQCVAYGISKSELKRITGIDTETIDRLRNHNHNVVPDEESTKRLVTILTDHLNQVKEQDEATTLLHNQVHNLLNVAYQEFGISADAILKTTQILSKDTLRNIMANNSFTITKDEYNQLGKVVNRLKEHHTFKGTHSEQRLLTWSKHFIANVKTDIIINARNISATYGNNKTIIALIPFETTIKDNSSYFNVVRCDNVFNRPITYVNALMLITALNQQQQHDVITFDILKSSPKMNELIDLLISEKFITNTERTLINGKFMHVSADIDHNAIAHFFVDMNQRTQEELEKQAYSSA